MWTPGALGTRDEALQTKNGIFTAEQVRDAVQPPPGDLHTAPTRVVCLENTHNGGGGGVWPIDHLRAVVAEAETARAPHPSRRARLMNAAVASGGTSAAEYGREFDTVTLCLSKGLGCPLGALVAGSRESMAKGRRMKHLFQGAMRQAGIVAAAGVYALEHNVERLAEDHANARRLGEGLAEAGLPVELDQVETNFVLVDVGRLGLAADEAVARLRAEGVLLSFMTLKDVLRATHLDVTPDDIEAACESIPRALASTDRPVELAGDAPTRAVLASTRRAEPGNAPGRRRDARRRRVRAPCRISNRPPSRVSCTTTVKESSRGSQ